MALKLFVVDDVAGTCDLRDLAPYTSVTSNNGSVVVVSTVDPVTGQPSYDLAAAVDVNVNNFSYNAVTKEITLTETDGDSYTINISDLVDTETVTTLVADGAGGFNYTNELGAVVNIPVAPILTASLGVERIGNDFQMDIDSLPDGVAPQCGDEVAVDRSGVDVRIPMARMYVGFEPFPAIHAAATSNGNSSLNPFPVGGSVVQSYTVNVNVNGLVPACPEYLEGWADVAVFSTTAIDELVSPSTQNEIRITLTTNGMSHIISRSHSDKPPGTPDEINDDRNANGTQIPIKLTGGVGSFQIDHIAVNQPGITGGLVSWGQISWANVLGVRPVEV